MQFVADIPRTPPPMFNGTVGIELTGRADYTGRSAPKREEFASFIFEQALIPLEGGKHFLRFKKPLTLKLNVETFRFTVEHWGVEMDCSQLPDLPRQIGRRFLLLLNAAENERLTETEQADWLRISDYLDFTLYSIHRSPPRYMEGILRSNTATVTVEWHDGTRETLDRNVADALNEVDVGERFAAFAKMGRDNKTLSIERVSLIGKEAVAEDWEQWPKKN